MAAKSIYPGELFLQEGNYSGEYLNGGSFRENEDDSLSAAPFYESLNGDVQESFESGTKSRPSSVNRLSSLDADYPVSAFLNDLRTIAQNLRLSSSMGTSSASESYNQRETPAAGVVIAGAGLAFNILSGAVSTLKQGDLSVTMPTTEIGVTASNIPSGLRLNTKTIINKVIFSYRETNPISGFEQVKIQLTCSVQYNGPEVKATFGFTPDGARSRMMRDTTINIRNPLNLQTIRTSPDWVRAGIPEYPVVVVPIEVRIDRPWPHSNANFSFNLVLSGMYGLGRTANSGFKENEIRRDN